MCEAAEYFSTAQLNILSLSIFLAKALNAKDDNGAVDFNGRNVVLYWQYGVNERCRKYPVNYC